MASEASKTKKPTVRTKPKTTRGKASSRKKVVKKKVKRDGFVAPKPLSIYDLHPMRKYIELLVYNCYTGRPPDYAVGKTVKLLDSVTVSKSQLQTKIKLKREILEVKRYLSEQIMFDNHPDQKIMMWDYIRNTEPVKSIDLKYHFVPIKISDVLRTSQQRKVIEGYTSLGASSEEIADVLNRNRELLEVTPEEVEIYQYFFWNLDSTGIMAIYPIQILSDYILQMRTKVRYNYRDIIDQHEKAGTLTDELKEKLEMQFTVYINTPYYLSDSPDVYKIWTNVVSGAKITPLGSFSAVIAVSNGDISPAKLNRMVEVSDYSVLTFDQQVQELSQKLVNAIESTIGDDMAEALNLIKGGLLPLSQTMILLNIPSKSAGKNLKDTARVHTSKVKDLKQIKGRAIIIDVDEDRKSRIKNIKDIEEADFMDIPGDHGAKS